MIYMDLFLYAEWLIEYYAKFFECLFVSQMNQKCIKKSVDVIVENEKTIFADGFFSISN